MNDRASRLRELLAGNDMIAEIFRVLGGRYDTPSERRSDRSTPGEG